MRTLAGVGKACRSPTGAPTVAARRLRSVIPAAIESCWQATALRRHSKIVGKRGGLRPRYRSTRSAEHIVSSGPEVKGRQVDVEPEQPTDETLSLRLGRELHVVSCENDLESGSIGGSNLADGQCERCAVDEQRAAVAVSVPRVDLILRASSQGPCSEVESERWPRMQLETNFDELPGKPAP